MPNKDKGCSLGVSKRSSSSYDGSRGARWALLPGAIIAAVCFAGFAVWTLLVSLTDSGLLPHYAFAGLHQYHRLFSSVRWRAAVANVAIFAGLLILGCSLLGYWIAALIDRCGRRASIVAVIVLLPLSVSFVVTGIVWRGMLDPQMGIQAAVRALGFKDFVFDWVVRTDRAIYVIALAGIWQQTGVSVLLFLAALRGVDRSIWNASVIDGIPTYRVYARIIAPMISDVFLLNSLFLLATAAKSFDLVMVLTSGGPGFGSDVPAHFIMEHIFERQELALGAAGASVLMMGALAAILPGLFVIARRRSES